MKRIVLWACLAAATLTVAPVFAEEEPQGEGHEITWKWVNFALLVGGLGYMFSRKAGRFFDARTAEIQKSIAEARRLKEEAEARLVEAEARLAGVAADIRALRESARRESEAESERVRREMEQELANIRAQAEMEIEAASNLARLQLKIHAGQLATDLARRKIQARLSPDAQDSLVDLFVDGLSREEERRRNGNLTVA